MSQPPRRPRRARAPLARGPRITERAQLAALATPLRQELLDSLRAAGGAASVRELAAQLGRPADGLYYHLRVLAELGLVTAEAGRSRAGRAERRYRLHGAKRGLLRVAYEPQLADNRDGLRALAAAMLRIADRDFSTALRRPELVVEGPARELWAARNKGWVSAAERRQLVALLERAALLLGRPRSNARQHLLSLCFVLAPIAAQPPRRGAAAAEHDHSRAPRGPARRRPRARRPAAARAVSSARRRAPAG